MMMHCVKPCLQCSSFLVNTKIPFVPQPLCLPGIILFDFWLFLRHKFGLKVHCFASVKKVQQNMTSGTQLYEKGASSGTSTSSRTDGAVGQQFVFCKHFGPTMYIIIQSCKQPASFWMMDNHIKEIGRSRVVGLRSYITGAYLFT